MVYRLFILNRTSPVTPGHGSCQSKKELRSKLHKLLPVDCVIQHNAATCKGNSAAHTDLLIPDAGSLPLDAAGELLSATTKLVTPS